MRTIVLTYPGFVSLPKGIKQMLVASERFYFDEARPALAMAGRPRARTENYWSSGALANLAGLKPQSSPGVAVGGG
jgi:hypothetical protein